MIKGNAHKREPSPLDDRVKWVLLVGMLSSVAVLLAGLALYIAKGSMDTAAISIGNIPSELLAGNPVAVISLGIILLLATPVLRVITVILTMAEKKDDMFTGIAFIVLVLLFISFILAAVK